MGATSDEKFFKRKLNEFDQELKRLQRELAKLKVLKREGGRARKQLVRSLQREMELQSIFEEEQADQFEDVQIEAEEREKPCCKKCNSQQVKSFMAGSRMIIVCNECEARSTIVPEIAKIA